MKKIFMLAALFAASSLSAQEKIRITEGDFAKNLSSVKVSLENVKAEKTEISWVKAGNYVSLRGYVNLNGSAFLPQNGGFVSANLTGWAQLASSDYKIKTDNQYITVYASFWVNPNQYVFQTVYPNVSFSVYNEGKFIGTVYSRDPINVSGWASGNYINLSGSGYLSASIYIPEN